MDILTEILTALKNRERVALATIVASSGSTPLPAGASMLVKRSGTTTLGTVGGGLLEAGVAEEALKCIAGNHGSMIKEFTLNESDSGEGMICGGSVEVLIEELGEEHLSLFSQLIETRDKGNDCTLLRVIDSTPRVVQRAVLAEVGKEAVQRPPLDDLLRAYGIAADVVAQRLRRIQSEISIVRVRGLTGELIFQAIPREESLVICGGGHIGRSLSKIATLAGFTVTVVDDREEYARASRFPEAARVLVRDWNKTFSEITIQESTSIVIVTRGHEFDKEALRQAVATPARYIGMIGSANKVAATYDALQKEGIPISILKRLHAPIGLDIGAVTAEEIAVSIVAELIRVRRAQQAASAPLSTRMETWFDHHETGSSPSIESRGEMPPVAHLPRTE